MRQRTILAITVFLGFQLVGATAFAQAWPSDWIERGVVQRATEAARDSLYSCYAEHVPKKSQKHGDIVKVRVTVSEAGNVFRVDFLESSYKSEEFEACVRRTIEGLDFGSRSAEKMVYLQKLGFQRGAANLTFDAPVPAGGAITKESVVAMARQRKAELMKCYTPRLEEKPGLRGQILFEVVIDGATGQVQSVKKVGTTLNDEKVASCALGVLRTFQFPVPTDPGLVIVRFPFTFDN